MAKHGKDTHNKPNPDRYKLLKSGGKRIDNDGISTLDYKIENVLRTRLFTKVIVSYDQKKILNSTLVVDNSTIVTTTANSTKKT
jgi:hypothetical protein